MRRLIVLLFFGVQAFAQTGTIVRVWAVDDGERIRKTRLNHPLATSSSNKVWNGSSVSLFGARNEIVAFQLILETGAAAASGVNVTLDSLSRQGSPAYAIRNRGGSDPYNFVGRRIELFVAHYMNVTERSTLIPWWSTARPGASGDPHWLNSDF
ncbi:MAG: hypothetical protein WB626_00650, partial [Bacteroidota bacterium]